jgi:hypothetical protein
MTQFGTFWQGQRLSAFEAACMHSFVAEGHEVTLFSFDAVANVPLGVKERDASLIADKGGLTAFSVNGVPSVSHFSDYFRYVMFAKTELTWIDTDVLLLRNWDHDSGVTLLALESPRSICNAVMRLSSREPILQELIARTEALMNRPIRWGDTGPRLLTRLAGAQALMSGAQPVHRHFPIHYNDFWKVFLPEYAEECRAQCEAARTLHLWNNIVERLGFWKEYLPPEDSYLHDLFIEKGCGRYFRGVFPLRNMKQLVDNWRSRQTGIHLGVRRVFRQLLPSIQRTYRHYAG